MNRFNNHRSVVALAALFMMSHSIGADFDYRVTGRKPQPRDHFVQGLQIVGDKLYVSTGRYGESRLLRYRFSDSKLESGRRLHPKLWGEGLTVLGDSVYQLTWKARLLLVYDRPTLQYRESFTIPGEGWGITHNGRELIYSDGSHMLHYMSPRTGKRLRSIAVTENGLPVPQLNELEWIGGKVWANVWRTNRIVIIDPNTGEVTAGINLTGLLPTEDRLPDTDVLNGIAVDPTDNTIWLTGKRWPWIYQIELVSPRESGMPAPYSQ
jgi:glutamine cyclotransferase